MPNRLALAAELEAVPPGGRAPLRLRRRAVRFIALAKLNGLIAGSLVIAFGAGLVWAASEFAGPLRLRLAETALCATAWTGANPCPWFLSVVPSD